MTPIELIVLKTLSRGPNHGFGIALGVQSASGGLLALEEGSLYPALHRMERDGLLASQWGVTDNSRRAKFYSLTKEGQQRLVECETAWKDTAAGVQRLLRYAG